MQRKGDSSLTLGLPSPVQLGSGVLKRTPLGLCANFPIFWA